MDTPFQQAAQQEFGDGLTPFQQAAQQEFGQLPTSQQSSSSLSGQSDMTSYITQKAQQLNLDPQAVLGVAKNEGLSGEVGDNGTSFGPFQLHIGGALPQEIAQQGADFAQKWAWSPEGIDFALQKMAQNGAAGLKGADAVNAIVYNFERPADPTADLQSGYNAIGN